MAITSRAQPIIKLLGTNPLEAIKQTYMIAPPLSGKELLMNDNVDFPTKARIARGILLDIRQGELERESFGAGLVSGKNDEPTQKKTAVNTLVILNNPEQIQLSEKETSVILDATYHIYGAPEELHPDLPLAERKVAAEKYLLKVQDQQQDTPSITLGDLREIEGHISQLSKLGPKDLVAKSELLEKITTKMGPVKDLLKTDPSKILVQKAAKKVITKGLTKVAGKAVATKVVGVAVSVAATPVVGAIVSFLVGKVLDFLSWLKAKFTRNKKGGIVAMAGFGVIGGLALGGAAGAALVGVGALALLGAGSAAVATFVGAVIAGILAIAGILVAPLVGGGLLLLFFTIFTIYVITTGAYVVPPGTIPGGAVISPPPPGEVIGGIVDNCPDASEDITSELASRISNGEVRLLPDYTGPRPQLLCIEPTMMIMHWSGGSNDNPAGNDGTYNTLISRNLACQLGTDTDNVELWQPFYEDMVEMSWCAGFWNSYSINNEMAGISFTDNPPPPNLTELEMAYDATCEIMDQYDIPWCQIFGHYEVPYNGGKTDPGAEFLQNVFIPEIRSRCPNDSGNICQ